MLRGEKEKIAFYVFAIIEVALSVTHTGIGLCDGCSVTDRLLYPFVHANIFHALGNLVVLWQCMSKFNVRWHVLVFYAIAVTFPLTSSTPIVGLSGFLYAWIGFIMPWVKAKLYYNCIITLIILAGFFLPGMAVGIHIYCYVVGMLWGYLNSPICKE